MQNLNDLYYFAQSVTHGGFAPASRAIGVPKSKLSRRVAALEERLGVRLINRSTRRFSITEIGETFYEHCKAMLVEAEAAQEAIDSVQSEPRGVIRMTCPITLLHVHIGAFLADFMARYPKITISLEATNRRVDVLNEGIDVAVRVRPPPLEVKDLELKVLSDRGLALVASPALIEKHGTPAAPADLHDWPSLSLTTTQTEHRWVLNGPDDSKAIIHHQPKLVTDYMIALRRVAMAGVGVVQLPILTVQEQLESGELVHLLPDWQPHRDIIHVVYPCRRGMLPAVRTLIDELENYYISFDEE